jgi:hypothetical protein
MNIPKTISIGILCCLPVGAKFKKYHQSKCEICGKICCVGEVDLNDENINDLLDQRPIQ